MLQRITWLALLSWGFVLAGSLPGSAQYQAYLHPESKLWIEGRTSINEFACEAGDVTGSGRLERQQVTPDTSLGDPEVEVLVAVRSFECGRSRMNTDLYETLQEEKHPVIRFDLARARIAETLSRAEDGFRPARVRAGVLYRGDQAAALVRVWPRAALTDVRPHQGARPHCHSR